MQPLDIQEFLCTTGFFGTHAQYASLALAVSMLGSRPSQDRSDRLVRDRLDTRGRTPVKYNSGDQILSLRRQFLQGLRSTSQWLRYRERYERKLLLSAKTILLHATTQQQSPTYEMREGIALETSVSVCARYSTFARQTHSCYYVIFHLIRMYLSGCVVPFTLLSSSTYLCFNGLTICFPRYL